MAAIEKTHCCGMVIYRGITYTGDTPAQALEKLGECIMQPMSPSLRYGIVVMADVGRQYSRAGTPLDTPASAGIGDGIADLIDAEQLGSIFISEWTKNPNSGNLIRTMTFNIDWEQFQPWLNRQPRYPTTRKEIEAKRRKAMEGW